MVFISFSLKESRTFGSFSAYLVPTDILYQFLPFKLESLDTTLNILVRISRHAP